MEAPTKFAIGIPYFFYDYIGRILPGAFLGLGTVFTWYGTGWLYIWQCNIQRLPKIETGAATLVFAVSLLLFVNIAALLGSMLASVSHHLVGDFRRWSWSPLPSAGVWRWPLLTLEGLWHWLGAPNTGSKLLQEKFHGQFDFTLTDKTLRGASDLCAYHLMETSPTLGTMTARHDAELLGTQSMVLAIAWMELLHVARLVSCWRDFRSFWLHWVVWCLILLVGLVGFALTFNYHRKKKLYGRFALYLAAKTATPQRSVSKVVSDGQSERKL